MTTARVNSLAFATVCNNALAFLPADASLVKVARVSLGPDGFEAAGTDGYAAGVDSCPVAALEGPPVTLLVTRDCLVLFDQIGRKDKKGSGVIEISASGVSYTPASGDVESVGFPNRVNDHMDALNAYQMIDECVDDPHEFRTAFQPMLLQRFAKVKADKTERVADLCIDDPDQPVLVKIGSTFKGLIMPVHREVYAQNFGEEGLW